MQTRRDSFARRYAWLFAILLVGTIYLFWILPLQLGSRPVEVEFVPKSKPLDKP